MLLTTFWLYSTFLKVLFVWLEYLGFRQEAVKELNVLLLSPPPIPVVITGCFLDAVERTRDDPEFVVVCYSFRDLMISLLGS